MNRILSTYPYDAFLDILLYRSKMSDDGNYHIMDAATCGLLVTLSGSNYHVCNKNDTVFVSRKDYGEMWKEYKERYKL